MNYYKITKNNRTYVIRAKDECSAVSKLRDLALSGANPQDFMKNPTGEELKAYDKFTTSIINGNSIDNALRSVGINDCEVNDKLIQSGSEEAFKKNIATEIRAGKDPKQAAAIAYSVQRKNDEEPKDFTYIMIGTTGEYKVENLTLQEAKRLLANNELLGYKGRIVNKSGVEIKDKSVFSEETTHSVQEALEKDKQEMGSARREMKDANTVYANSLDDLLRKIDRWDEDEPTTFIYSPKGKWHYEYVITIGHKYNYYAYVRKTAHGVHENPYVNLENGNIDKSLSSNRLDDLKTQIRQLLR